MVGFRRGIPLTEEEDILMTDIKKTQKAANSTKAKKLNLNKETIKDLSARDPKQVKGGGLCQYTVHASCS